MPGRARAQRLCLVPGRDATHFPSCAREQVGQDKVRSIPPTAPPSLSPPGGGSWDCCGASQ